MLWTRTSRSHDISGPVEEVSVLVVLDGGACAGALQVAAAGVRVHRRAGSARIAPRTHRTHRHRHHHQHQHQHHATCHGERATRPHDPSSVVPNNQTMERLPVRQATFGMVCRTCCYKSRRVGAAEARERATEPADRLDRPPPAAGREDGTGRDGIGCLAHTHTLEHTRTTFRTYLG